MRIITNCVMLETGGTRRKTQETQGKTGRNTTGFLLGSYVRACVRPCTRKRTRSCVRIRPRRGIHPPGRKSFRAGPSPTSTGLVCEKNSPISVHRNTHAQRQPETVSRWAFSCYPKPDFRPNKDPSGAARGVVLCPGYGLGFLFCSLEVAPRLSTWAIYPSGLPDLVTKKEAAAIRHPLFSVLYYSLLLSRSIASVMARPINPFTDSPRAAAWA